MQALKAVEIVCKIKTDKSWTEFSLPRTCTEHLHPDLAFLPENLTGDLTESGRIEGAHCGQEGIFLKLLITLSTSKRMRASVRSGSEVDSKAGRVCFHFLAALCIGSGLGRRSRLCASQRLVM